MGFVILWPSTHHLNILSPTLLTINIKAGGRDLRPDAHRKDGRGKRLASGVRALACAGRVAQKLWRGRGRGGQSGQRGEKVLLILLRIMMIL